MVANTVVVGLLLLGLSAKGFDAAEFPCREPPTTGFGPNLFLRQQRGSWGSAVHSSSSSPGSRAVLRRGGGAAEHSSAPQLFYVSMLRVSCGVHRFVAAHRWLGGGGGSSLAAGTAADSNPHTTLLLHHASSVSFVTVNIWGGKKAGEGYLLEYFVVCIRVSRSPDSFACVCVSVLPGAAATTTTNRRFR